MIEKRERDAAEDGKQERLKPLMAREGHTVRQGYRENDKRGKKKCTSIIIIIIINLFAIFSYQIADTSCRGRPPEKHKVQLGGGL